MTDERWGEVREGLRSFVGANNYRSWIEPLKLKGLSQGVATFAVPTPFFGNFVSQNFGDQIIYQLSRSGETVERLNFVAANEARAPACVKDGTTNGHSAGYGSGATQHGGAVQTVGAAVAAPGKDRVKDGGGSGPDSGRGLADGGQLDARFTFDSFVVGKPNELAHAAARKVAEGGSVTFNPLFMYGGVGLGKTHLMHAIANELRTRQPHLNVVYLSAEQFMYRFITALRERKMIDFKQLFRSVDVLMVDDVQFIAGKDSTQEEFFHTFNALVDAGRQIVISADRAPGEIKDLEERIKSRLQCGLVVDLHPTDYELRLGVLQAKVEQFAITYPGVEVHDGVLEFLAHRISTNVRVLEGALTRLFAFASLVGREVSLDLTQDCLADVLRASDRKITIEEIQRRVSEHYNIRLSDLIGPKRTRNFARPRQVAMWLSKQLTNRSLPDIGRRFGKRDHTTVMHGVRKIDELRATDSQIADDLEMLRRTLEA